jgi:hypothetical protein
VLTTLLACLRGSHDKSGLQWNPSAGRKVIKGASDERTDGPGLKDCLHVVAVKDIEPVEELLTS